MANLKINKNGNYIEVLINETGKAWTILIEKAKKILAENLEVKGFRKGHVPDNIVEKKISKQAIWNKAADLLIDNEYKAAIELLLKENIATKPLFEVKAVSDESIEAVLKSVSMPKVKIGNRDEIKIDFKIEKITDEEVNTEAKKFNELLTKNIELDDLSAIAKNGDQTNIDFLGKVNGVAFDGGESKNFNLKLGSNSFIDGFEPQVIGMKIKEVKDIKVTFPNQYPEKTLAGKEAIFTVTLNSIKKIIELEGEELKEKLNSFGFSSKNDIVIKIKELLKNKKNNEANDKYFRSYVDEIIKLKDTEVTLPDEIINQEIDQEFKRIEAQISEQGMNMKDYLKMLGISAQEFKNNTIKESSIKRVKDGLIYSQLISDLEIKAEVEDYNKEYEKIAKNSKTSVEEVQKKVNSASIESNIIFSKLIKLIK